MLRKHNLFEETLRKKLENQIAEPPPHAWKNIREELDGRQKKLGYRSLSLAMLLLLLLSGTGAYYFYSKLNHLEEALNNAKNELSETRNKLQTLKSAENENQNRLHNTQGNEFLRNGILPDISFLSLGKEEMETQKETASFYMAAFSPRYLNLSVPSFYGLAFSDPAGNEASKEEKLSKEFKEEVEDEKEKEKRKSFSFYLTGAKSNLLVKPNKNDDILVSSFISDNAFQAEIGARYSIANNKYFNLFAGAGVLFSRNDYDFIMATDQVAEYEITSTGNDVHVNTIQKSVNVSSENWSVNLKPEIGIFYYPGQSGRWVASASLAYLRSLISSNRYYIEGESFNNTHLRNENLAFSTGFYRTYLMQNQSKLSVGPWLSGYFFSASTKDSPLILNNYSAGLSLLLDIE